MLSILSVPTQAQSLEVIGYAGALGEWEVAANVTGVSNRTQDFSGPLTMRHTGVCTQDGPEERTGQIRFQISPSRLNAKLSIAGVECSFSAGLSDAYKGQMICPDRPAVPLTLWVR
ncbi:MAG: hypothetical protein E6G97_05055 [Alphaproteobacteria bacterium]|nr:MAG: hypothetical protein E6G97_05055 [Alphaproteobacteria bacterium]